MTLEYGKSRLLVPALLAASIGLSGCGGGGGGGDGGGGGGNTPATAITVTPEDFNFGVITEGNLEQTRPREFVIRNQGARSYNIADIGLQLNDHAAFVLDRSGGNNPCEARPFDLAPGDSCTVEVEFKPRSFAPFVAALFVETDDPESSTVGGTLAKLAGTYAEIDSINVTVNQINACPRPDAIAYVSVTDQAGFPIRNLHDGHFTLDGLTVRDIRQVGGNPTDTDLALSIVMDYSGSITDDGGAENMELGAKRLVDAMNDNDEADIIKYAEKVKVMTSAGFTADKNFLKEKIDERPPEEEIGRSTAFYDATVKAIDRIQTSDKHRKAVIALTDGEDTSSVDAELGDAIREALGIDVPVFTVGFGQFLQEEELQKLAAETGGLFYRPAGDANLLDVFGYLASVLFEDQYIIYFQLPEGDERSSLKVNVEYLDEDSEKREGDGSKIIPACS